MAGPPTRVDAHLLETIEETDYQGENLGDFLACYGPQT
jgi:hypothetical protein